MVEEYYAGVDLGGTNLRVSLADKEGIKIKLTRGTMLEGENDTIPKQIGYLIGEACSRVGIEKDRINVVGVSTCSPFEKRERYRVVVTPNLCGGLTGDNRRIPNDWMEIPLEKKLVEKYRGNVKIENDCVSAVVAEGLFGAGRGEDNFVYITWSTGIGAGAYVDGKLIRGKNGNAPHFGHIYISEDGPQCGCGNFGDLESLCSGAAIARDYGNADTERVFNLYKRGDRKAVEIVNKAARNFARGLASINAILDTKIFIIGGSVFMNNYDILLPLIKDEFYKSFSVLSKGV